MDDVIRFVQKPERGRVRVIQEARELYDRIFPPKQQDKTPISHTVGGANAHRGDEAQLS